MKKMTLLPLAMCICLAIAWGTAGMPLADSAVDNNKSAEKHFEKAIELLRQADHEAAIAEYEKVIQLVPESKIAQDAQYWIGQSYFRMGLYDEALSIFKKLIGDYPKSAIVPVTQLMMAQVQQEKENEKLRARSDSASDNGVIVDPETGVKYTKTTTFTGKRDMITYPGWLKLSPNGKFLLWDKLVVPLDGGEPFDLVDMPAFRGSWSPDGEKVAFYSGESWHAIWMIPVSPDTGRPTGPAKKLLDAEYSFRHISWSPDSERIAFARRDEESSDIWTLSVRDGTLTQITDDPYSKGGLVWSPDGKTIAYSRVSRSIWLVPAEGGTPKKIIDDGRRVQTTSWSPDGKWLVCNSGVTSGKKYWFFRLADGREFEVNPHWSLEKFLGWSPDGKKVLLYRSSYDYMSILKAVSTSGGPSFELGKQLTLWPYGQFWSPDSRMIITYGQGKDGDYGLWTIPLAGGDPFLLELDVSVPGSPKPHSLSPDGRKLLFSVKRGEKTKDLWVVPVSLKDGRTTGPAVMVFSGLGRQPEAGVLAWSPDGTKLAIRHKWHIWIASAEGGEPVQITKTPGGVRWPVWSPDGEMIAYIYSYSAGKSFLHVIPASGGEARKILDDPSGYRYKYTWSPDGKELAVFSEGVISAIPMAGGKARQILDLKDMAIAVYFLRWSPDGQNLAFIGIREAEGRFQIFIVPAEGGKVTELAADDLGEKYYIYWSPDGKWISYNSDGMVKTRSEGAIWEADLAELLSGGEQQER